MNFFDPKQDVMDIQLTKYGKKLLSVGNFKPQYYCFFDDDVIYDGLSFGEIENQNNIETRILEETPYLKCQTNFSSSDETLNLDSISDVSNFLGIPLHSCDPHNQKVGSFDIQFKKGEIEKIQLSGSERYNLYSSEYVPQIILKEREVMIIAEKDIDNFNVPAVEGTLESNSLNINVQMLSPAQDGTFVYLSIPQISLEVYVDNIENYYNDLEFEVHKIEFDNAEMLTMTSDTSIRVLPNENDILESETFQLGFIEDSATDGELVGESLGPEGKKLVSSYFDIEFEDQPLMENSDKRLYIYDGPTLVIPKGEIC